MRTAVGLIALLTICPASFLGLIYFAKEHQSGLVSLYQQAKWTLVDTKRYFFPTEREKEVQKLIQKAKTLGSVNRQEAIDAIEQALKSDPGNREAESIREKLLVAVAEEQARNKEAEKEAEVANARDEEGLTKLHRAAVAGRKEEVESLLAKGATIDAINNHGATPLYYAAYAGQAEIVDLLISKGADVNSKANDGTTPLSVALTQRHDSVASLLREKGGTLIGRSNGEAGHPAQVAQATSDITTRHLNWAADFTASLINDQRSSLTGAKIDVPTHRLDASTAEGRADMMNESARTTASYLAQPNGIVVREMPATKRSAQQEQYGTSYQGQTANIDPLQNVGFGKIGCYDSLEAAEQARVALRTQYSRSVDASKEALVAGGGNGTVVIETAGRFEIKYDRSTGKWCLHRAKDFPEAPIDRPRW
jgi:hypothetical protein